VFIFYLVKRVGIFLLIVWLAATINFFLPRLGGQNPVAQKIMQQAALGGNLHVGMQDMVKEYETKFGLTKPLWSQYLT
jgi:peptide/nickel transport system permease protein